MILLGIVLESKSICSIFSLTRKNKLFKIFICDGCFINFPTTRLNSDAVTVIPAGEPQPGSAQVCNVGTCRSTGK